MIVPVYTLTLRNLCAGCNERTKTRPKGVCDEKNPSISRLTIADDLTTAALLYSPLSICGVQTLSLVVEGVAPPPPPKPIPQECTYTLRDEEPNVREETAKRTRNPFLFPHCEIGETEKKSSLPVSSENE